jgi:phenylpyruvate tautomerase PptA (4-oxalocrotonate tautomerase family)
MDTIREVSRVPELTDTSGGLSRRGVLKGASMAAGALAGVSPVVADTEPATSFGAPLVEVQVPAGVLTLEQKGAIIKGVSDVLMRATKVPPDQARRLWVQIFETAEGGWGLGGNVFVPRK